MKDLDKASIPNAGGNFQKLKLFLFLFQLIYFLYFFRRQGKCAQEKQHYVCPG